MCCHHVTCDPGGKYKWLCQQTFHRLVYHYQLSLSLLNICAVNGRASICGQKGAESDQQQQENKKQKKVIQYLLKILVYDTQYFTNLNGVQLGIIIYTLILY